MVVVQEEENGCGFGAVANITQLPYSTIKSKANSLGIFAGDELLFSETNYVRKLLSEYGYTASPNEIAFQNWDSLPDLALLSIKFTIKNERPYWHWVVFKREGNHPVVLDSSMQLTNNLRTDFNNMQPKWYVQVSKT